MLYFGVLCFDRQLPQAMCSSQRIYRCSGVHMEACHNSYLSKNHIVARFSWGSSETQSLFSKQSLNKLLLPLGALVTSQTQLDVSNVPIVDEDKIRRWYYSRLQSLWADCSDLPYEFPNIPIVRGSASQAERVLVKGVFSLPILIR